MANDGRGPARSFRDLLVWQRAHALALETYRLTTSFPKHEIYGLTSQLRRSAVSIPANITEAFRRRGDRDKARILNVAEASLEETHYYFILATDLGYADCMPLIAELEEISRMLHAYRKRILTSDP